MAPLGMDLGLADRTYRLESKARTLEERLATLREMETFCRRQGADTQWEQRNLENPLDKEMILKVTINSAATSRLRTQACLKRVSVHKNRTDDPKLMLQERAG